MGYIAGVADCPLPLTVQESPGQVRLCLGSLAHGDGPTLQDAADDLVQRLLSYVMAFRASGFRPSLELAPPDLAAMDFLYQLGEIAAAGGDIRSRLFSWSSRPPPGSARLARRVGMAPSSGWSRDARASAAPGETTFVDAVQLAINTILPNDCSSWDTIDELVE
jgi:hypothetical protein